MRVTRRHSRTAPRKAAHRSMSRTSVASPFCNNRAARWSAGSLRSRCKANRKDVVMDHKIGTRNEWLKARKALLIREKELMRQRDALAANRRELPWVKVEKN